MSGLPETDLMRVLVVGANSYIGDNFARYAAGRLHVDTVDSYAKWKATPFHEYDSVLIVAGLAHQKWNRKQQEANKDKYFAINHDLAVAIAEKANADGAGQVIYLSSMAVFGRVEGAITVDTKATPRKTDYYGQSKYKAEESLTLMLKVTQAPPPSLEGGGYRPGVACLCIIRPPMVYGPGCPGKFAALVKVAKKLPVIPKVNNRRSMIYIDNLSEFICLAVEQRIAGIFHPHNKDYMNTTWLINSIANTVGKRRLIMPGLGLAVRCMKPFSTAIKTAFGSLYYDEDIVAMPFEEDYQLVSATESVERSTL